MTRVLLGISGGVDSSVAALLLKRDGHEVVAVTLLFHDEKPSVPAPCGPVSAPAVPLPTVAPLKAEVGEVEMAASVCAKLGIEHHVIDVRERFANTVQAHVLSENARGLRPDVCPFCTSEFKIPMLFELADEFKCRYVATGHYAKLVEGSLGRDRNLIQLNEALDRSKDQSFLLYGLGQSQLMRMMFPLADVHKSKVREEAMRANLMMAPLEEDDTPCLHKGSTLNNWLIGRGEKPADPIIDFDNYAMESCIVRDVKWTSIKPLAEKRSCKVKLNIRESARPVQLVPNEDGTVTMSFTVPRKGLVPGKTVVFYSDKLVLGGGVIA